MSSAGDFWLTKWISNNREVLDTALESERGEKFWSIKIATLSDNIVKWRANEQLVSL